MKATEQAPVPIAARRRPLGLPSGSIRAILSLLIISVIVTRTVRSEPVGLLWVETLMIALAHYFTSRRFVDLPAEVLRRLEDDGVIEREGSPLYLPRHTIRILIFLIFAGLAVWLHRRGRLIEYESISLLGAVAVYFFGLLWRAVVVRIQRWRPSPPQRRWQDIKAIVVLLLVGTVALAHLLGLGDLLPLRLDEMAVAAVLFYFGSR